MLADLIVAASFPKVSPCFGEDIRRAEKFVFEQNVYDAIVQVADWSVKEIYAALPLCRPPHLCTWIESHRGPPLLTQVMNEEGADIGKCGVLIRCTDETQKSLIGVMCWQHRNKNAILLSHLAVQINIDEDFDVSEFEQRRTEIHKENPELALPIKPTALTARIAFGYNPYTDTELKGDLIDDAFSATISRWIIASLALLNSRNMIVKIPSDLSALNRSRRKRCQSELMSYSTVKITLNKRDARIAANSGMSPAEIRRHMVRGHFKIKKHGIYWWRPFIRGHGPGEVRHRQYDIVKN